MRAGESSFANKDQRRLSFVSRGLRVSVSAFQRNADGRKILGSDDASSLRRSEVRIAPGDGRAHGFGGIALAVCRRGQDPTDFRRAFEWWLQIALVVGKSDLSDEITGGFFFDGPITKTQQLPVAGVAQKLRPGFFFGEGLATGVLCDFGVGPHGGGVQEILHAMGAELEARCFEDGDFCG
jgi:hypothetical protein